MTLRLPLRSPRRLAWVRAAIVAIPWAAAAAAALAGITALTPVMAQPLQLSPLTSTASAASAEHHVGKVVLVQLVTPDLDAAKRFYGGLFDWRFRDLTLGGEAYAEALLDGQLVAGLLYKPVAAGTRRQSSWLSFIAVRDVDATRNLAVANGARVLLAPHTLPRRGREAVLADPQGAVFALLASSSGDPPDEMADAGEWIWSSLSTTDPEADAGFYQTLFGYEVFDLPDGPAGHLLLASENYARASANPLSGGNGDARPHWLNYVHVADVAAASAKALALGGRVLVQPRLDRHGGRVAIVADPMGAPFGLLEWPQAQGKEIQP